MITVRTNLPEFKSQIDRSGKEFVEIVRSASRSAAREIAKEVRRFAPRHTGRLRQAVVIKRARRVPRGTVQYIVGIRQGFSNQHLQRIRKGQKTSVNLDAFYWRFLEGGWMPRGPGNKLLGGRFGNRRKALERSRLRAGGARFVRHPFIGPAFSSASGRALSAFYRAMDQGLKEIK